MHSVLLTGPEVKKKEEAKDSDDDSDLDIIDVDLSIDVNKMEASQVRFFLLIYTKLSFMTVQSWNEKVR